MTEKPTHFLRRKLVRFLNSTLYHSDDIKSLYQMFHKNEECLKKLKKEKRE